MTLLSQSVSSPTKIALCVCFTSSFACRQQRQFTNTSIFVDNNHHSAIQFTRSHHFRATNHYLNCTRTRLVAVGSWNGGAPDVIDHVSDDVIVHQVSGNNLRTTPADRLLIARLWLCVTGMQLQ